MAYGYIQTASNVARQLRELNKDYRGRKTLESMYSTIDAQEQSALSDLTYDYDLQVAKAYSTAFANKSAVANSAYGTGYKQQGSADIDAALQEAFMSYKQNYLSSAAKVESSANEARADIDAAIANVDEQTLQDAQNYVDYQNSAYTYLKYLYNKAFPGEDADYDADSTLTKMFNEDINWSKYIVKEKVLNEDGTETETSRLMTQQELMQRNYDMDATGQGTINKAGVDFYDQMLNSFSQEASSYSFHAWLAEKNPKLYDWSQQGSWIDTEAGTNIGAFKKFVGLESTDDQYKFIERFGGFSEDEVKTQLQTFANDVSTIVNSGERKNTKELLTAYSTALDDVSKYVNSLDLDPDTREKLITTITSIQETIKAADVKHTSDVNNDADVQTWSEVAEQVKEDWVGVQRELSTGNVATTGAELATLGINAIGTFATSLIMDLGHFLFRKTTRAMKNATGRDPYRDRATSRITSNKELITKIESSYLDLMTILASYAK